jgi:hypothetical protein
MEFFEDTYELCTYPEENDYYREMGIKLGIDYKSIHAQVTHDDLMEQFFVPEDQEDTLEELIEKAISSSSYVLPMIPSSIDMHEDIFDDFRVSPSPKDIISGKGQNVLEGVREKRDGIMGVSYIKDGKQLLLIENKSYSTSAPLGTYEICGNDAYLLDGKMTKTIEYYDKVIKVLTVHENKFMSPSKLYDILPEESEGLIALISGLEYRVKKKPTREGKFLHIPHNGYMRLEHDLIRYDEFCRLPKLKPGDVIEYEVATKSFVRKRYDKKRVGQKYNERALVRFVDFKQKTYLHDYCVPDRIKKTMVKTSGTKFLYSTVGDLVSVIRSSPFRFISVRSIGCRDYRSVAMLQLLGFQIVGERCYISPRVKCYGINLLDYYHNITFGSVRKKDIDLFDGVEMLFGKIV